jgi:TRAP transporter 4TM/12TM fusion protein
LHDRKVNAASSSLPRAESARSAQSALAGAAIVALCLAWSGFQLYIAWQPINAHIARTWHLAFAVSLAYLLYPAYRARRGAWVAVGEGFCILLLAALGGYALWSLGAVRATRGVDTVTVAVLFAFGLLAALEALRRTFLRRAGPAGLSAQGVLLAGGAAAAALYIWWDYDALVMRQGLPTGADVAIGVLMIVLLLEATRRALGMALSVLAGLFIAYAFAGPYLPDLLRHRGIPLDFLVSDLYLSDIGIFGVPLGVSTAFVFLFVLFGALLEKAGAGRYFIDVAFAGLGHLRGGPAKAAVAASGLTGMVSGSSIANTVTTGTFTIPLMKRVGLPAHKAGAVEVAASTNGQLMPPVMGAAAFIMAEILGIPYLDVVRAALFPALISYLTLFYIVHLEASKLGLPSVPRSELPPLLKTALRGLHFLVPLAVLIFYLVIERRSPIASALFAIEALAVIMLVQRPLIALLGYGLGGARELPLGRLLALAALDGLRDIWAGLIAGARNMVPVGVATATAGIIVGVVTSTGLVGRFTVLIDVLAFGNIYLVLGLTALTSIVLGMGLPTTANYIIMATLTAPVIVTLGADAGLVFPLIAAHLFVFYYGILADDTPPVGLAAYAAAAIAQADPIRTGIQGFSYDLRTAVLPFIFIFNVDLLMVSEVTPGGTVVWIDDPLRLTWIFTVGLLAMFAFAAALQGWLAVRCSLLERALLLAAFVAMMRPALVTEPVPQLAREGVQAAGLAAIGLLYAFQRLRASAGRRKRAQPGDRT